jgi:hypothetical protein
VRAALIDFDRAIRDLRAQILRFRVEEQLLALNGESEPEEFASLTRALKEAVEPWAFKQANYSTTVVLLYAAFERLVDRLLIASTGYRADVTPFYSWLPERLQANHRRRTVDAINDERWQSRSGVSVQTLAERLHLCESDSPNYKLNSAVFARHVYNYRIDSLVVALQDSGCPEPRARLEGSARLAGLAEVGGSAVHPSRVLEWADDLAIRRNEVAHGTPTDLLSLDELDLRVCATWRLGVAVFETLVEDLAHVLRQQSTMSLGKIGKVHYKTACVVDLGQLKAGTVVSVGDVGIMASRRRGRLEVSYGGIESIQRSGQTCDEVRAEAGVVVGLKFSFRLREGADLVIHDRSSPLSWLGQGLPVTELIP